MPIKIPEVKNLNANVGASSLRVSLGVAQQQANALGSLAAPIGATGDMLFNLSQKIQEADNVKNVSEAELSFDEQSAKYLQSLEGDFEENEWVPGATEMAKNMRKQFESRNLSPSAKRRLATKLDRKESSLLLRVGGMAAQQIAERANESTLLQLEMAAEAGDQFSYNEVVEERVAAGISSPEEGDRLKHEGTRKIRTAAIMGLANTNPKDAMEEIADGKWDDLPLDTRNRALYRAKIVDNEHQREFYDDITLAMEQDPPEVPSVDQVNTWAESGTIRKRDAIGLLKRINASGPLDFDAVRYLEIQGNILDYNPNKDDEAKTQLTDLKNQIALSEFSGSDRSRLKTQLIGAMQGDNLKASGRVMTMARDRIEFYSEQGYYGLKRDEEGKVTPESKKIDADNKAKDYQALAEFFKEYPEATFEEGLKAADDIVRERAELGGAKSLTIVTESAADKKANVDNSDGLPSDEIPPSQLAQAFLGEDAEPTARIPQLGNNLILFPALAPESKP
jgi:Fe-S cluster assembly iron-binding protein IscA